MIGTLGPDVARAAVALRKSHPSVPALRVLDTCMRQRTGCLQDFGDTIEPGSPFGRLLAEVFDEGPAKQDWSLCLDPAVPAGVISGLKLIWATQVLARFAEHYGLKV